MSSHQLSKYIAPLHVNGLNGRMLRMPAPKNKSREILLLYGHHASIERMAGFAEVVNRYGAVTMPDLPGLGGMDSFYKIGEKPTVDNYADYLASIVKLRYKRRRVTIIAMSFSFPLVVRMLQKYPELESKVDILVSTVGFVHHDDFKFNRFYSLCLRSFSRFGSYRISAFLIRYTLLCSPMIRLAYGSVKDRHTKLKDADAIEAKKRIEFEVELWHINDVRTRMYTMNLMFKMDVCSPPLPTRAYHVAPDQDRYFDNNVVEQHMRVIFDNFEVLATKMPAHAPSIIATAKDAAPYVPPKLRRILRTSRN